MIPKKIHIIYLQGWEKVPLDYKNSIDKLKLENPDWEVFFYDESDALNLLEKNFPKENTVCYYLISNDYPAAKADFLRYHILYLYGGIYLDVKSSFSNIISNSIDLKLDFIGCHWKERGGKFYRYGRHLALRGISPLGEIQQWNIISKKRSPLILQVIEDCIHNIFNYNPFKDGISKGGVLRVTGPITYTKSIFKKLPELTDCNYKFYSSHEDINLVFDIREDSIRKLSNTHYTKMKTPLTTNIKVDVAYIMWAFSYKFITGVITLYFRVIKLLKLKLKVF